MRVRLRIALIGLLALSMPAWMAAASNVAGTWAGVITDRGRQFTFDFILKQDGEKVTGTVNGVPPQGGEQPIVDGKIAGDRITLKINLPGPGGNTAALVYEGKINGDQIEGMASSPGEGNLPFRVTRAAAAQFSGTGSGQFADSDGTFGPQKGWLVIDGGEEPVLPAIAQRFVSLAGGPEANIVLVPTAMSDPTEKEVETYSKWLGAKNITVLNARDRAVANSEAFVAPLRRATGVWFTGGVESNLVNAYVGTLFQKELDALLARGGVIGGSSAGAFMLGAIALVPPKMSPSGFVPEDNRTFGFVRNVFIIPHVIQMNWENRMAEGMAAFRGVLGIGVDAGAALVVHGNRCEVIGDSKVLLPNGSGAGGKGYEALTAGAQFDLAKAMKKVNVQPDQSRNKEMVRR